MKDKELNRQLRESNALLARDLRTAIAQANRYRMERNTARTALQEANATVIALTQPSIVYDVVFDKLPGHESASFVEVEVKGVSVRRNWITRDDGCVVLRFHESAAMMQQAQSNYAAERAESLVKVIVDTACDADWSWKNS